MPQPRKYRNAAEKQAAYRARKQETTPCRGVVHERMFAALQVLLLSPATRAWLQANDPNALKQAQAAVDGYLLLATGRDRC